MKALVRLLTIFALLIIPYHALGAVSGAELFLDPVRAKVTAGEEFLVHVKIDTHGAQINALEAIVAYPVDLVEVVKITKSRGVLTIWSQEPHADVADGTIVFSGGVPSPGFSGVGEVLSFTLKARVAGPIVLALRSGAVLANDGKGTNVLAKLSGAAYESVPQNIVPAAVPLADNEVPFAPPPQLPALAFPSGEVGSVSDSARQPAMVKGEKSGDTNPPFPFALQAYEGLRTTCVTPSMLFQTTDLETGLLEYEVQLDNQAIARIPALAHQGGVRLPALRPGTHTVTVVARDRAQNTTVRSSPLFIEALPAPQILEAPRRVQPDMPLAFAGRALPGSSIGGRIVKGDEAAILFAAQADEKGNWRYVHEATLPSGRYAISVSATDYCGGQSPPSKEVRVSVSGEGYIRPFVAGVARTVQNVSTRAPQYARGVAVAVKSIGVQVAAWWQGLWR